MRLSERALLVQLHIHQWGINRVDAKVTADVAKQHEIEEQEDRYVKRLMPTAAMRPIINAAQNLRFFHYENTLPWQDRGIRVLPSTNYFQYVAGMRKFTDEFERRVKDFANKYDHWVDEAKRMKKALFNKADYPPQDEVAKMFGIRVVFLPFPDAADFRVNLGEDEVARIRKVAETEFRSAADEAVKELKTRIVFTASKLYNFMVRGQQFRQNSLDAMLDLFEISTRLNLTNDPQLIEVITSYTEVFKTRCEHIRADPLVRRRLQDTCSIIVRTLETK